jgi:hypothetical protein
MLATLRTAKRSPGEAPRMMSGGTRASEQPMMQARGSWVPRASASNSWRSFSK